MEDRVLITVAVDVETQGELIRRFGDPGPHLFAERVGDFLSQAVVRPQS